MFDLKGHVKFDMGVNCWTRSFGNEVESQIVVAPKVQLSFVASL
jgi:hypothetical protein